MRWGLVLVVLGSVGEALAAPPWRSRKAPVEPEPVEQAPPPVPALRGPLFDGPLPLDVGAAVTGLANPSAQGCRACHPVAHDGWAAGPHGPMSDAMREAVADAAIPACASCHLPLIDQHDEVPTWAHSDAPGAPNPGWDGTLRAEGVTCAACHLREGRVAVASEEAAAKLAPHPMAYAPDLGDERACAACHQLTWPGADTPLYDTVGEWTRSAWNAAGVGCVDCHFTGLAPHGEASAPARAWSLIVRPARRRYVRGSGPLEVSIRLQNTGAGHAMPSGSPFRGYRLTAKLARAGGQDAVAGVPELAADLVRLLSDAPPWTTVSDTRLPAGGERTWSWAPTLSQRLPAGRYDLVVELWRTRRGAAVGEPVVRQRLDLLVE